MNTITLVQTYYNDVDFLKQAIEHWNTFTTSVSIILIDDGSAIYPAVDIIANAKFNKNLKVSFLVVEEDIGFNSHGCRNLGASVAETDWIIFLDIDHAITSDDLFKLQTMNLSNDKWYSFITRHNNITFPSLNSFMCSKEMFHAGGGYDESFVPHHYGDREYLNMMDSKYPREELTDIIIQCMRAGRKVYIDDKLPAPIYDNEKLLMTTPSFHRDKVIHHDKRINFPWKKVF
jgi:predicted glycosyltransferase involved in capsule biosynthesis